MKQHIIKAKPVDNFKQLINQSVKLLETSFHSKEKMETHLSTGILHT